MKEKMRKLGERELDIMQVLWRAGSATVTQVHQELLERGGEAAYTTVQTMLNRLEAKGYVTRDAVERAHLYRPLLKESTAVKGAIRRLTERFFQGSAEELAARLVEQNLDAKQLARIQALIDAQHKKESSK